VRHDTLALSVRARCNAAARARPVMGRRTHTSSPSMSAARKRACRVIESSAAIHRHTSDLGAIYIRIPVIRWLLRMCAWMRACRAKESPAGTHSHRSDLSEIYVYIFGRILRLSVAGWFLRMSVWKRACRVMELNAGIHSQKSDV